MIGRTILAAAIVVFMVTPGLAFYCPKNVKAIDAALGKSMLGADQKSKVKGLRDKGLAQHKAGDHKGAVKSLAEAVRIILNNM